MEMMLKSMGIQTDAIKQLLDPENVKKLLSKIETLCNSVEDVKQAVLRIELKLGTLPDNIAQQLLADGQSEAFKEAVEFVRGYNGDSGNSNNGSGNDTRPGIGSGAASADGRGI
jgi:hypothetical protein